MIAKLTTHSKTMCLREKCFMCRSPEMENDFFYILTGVFEDFTVNIPLLIFEYDILQKLYVSLPIYI